MSETLQQDISALLDGELDELGLARVLAGMNDNEERRVMQRYSIAQSVLQGEQLTPQALNIDLSKQIGQVIEGLAFDEQGSAQDSQPKKAVNGPSKWLQPAMGFAVAASVAFLMVFSVDYWNQLQGSSVDTFAFQDSSLSEQAAAGAQVAHVSWAEEQLNDPYQVVVAADQELRRREEALLKAQQENARMQQHLREYLIRHSRQSSAINPINNVMPITRASYSAELR